MDEYGHIISNVVVDCNRLISPDGHTTVAVLVFSTTQQEVQGQVEAVRKAIVHTRLRTYVTGEPAVNHDISLASERDLRVAEAWARSGRGRPTSSPLQTLTPPVA